MACAPSVPMTTVDHRHRRSAVRQSGRSTVWTSEPTVCFSKFLRAGCNGCRLPEAPSTTTGVLVLRRRRHLILCQFERDAVTLIGDASEMQRIPINDGFPAADTEKTTEIDDSSTHQAGTIDDHVDNPPMSSSAGLRVQARRVRPPRR